MEGKEAEVAFGSSACSLTTVQCGATRLLLCACIPHSNTKNLQFTSFQRVAVHRPSPPSRPPPDSTLFRWVFFDDEKTSETYAEQLTHCPEYGRSLERKALRATTPSLLP